MELEEESVLLDIPFSSQFVSGSGFGMSSGNSVGKQFSLLNSPASSNYIGAREEARDLALALARACSLISARS